MEPSALEKLAELELFTVVVNGASRSRDATKGNFNAEYRIPNLFVFHQFATFSQKKVITNLQV